MIVFPHFQNVQGGPKVTSQRFKLIALPLLGVCQDSHWFKENLEIIEIDVHFSNERSFFTPLTCLDHIPFGQLLFGPSRYKYTVKIRALACPVLEMYRAIDCVHHPSHGVL